MPHWKKRGKESQRKVLGRPVHLISQLAPGYSLPSRQIRTERTKTPLVLTVHCLPLCSKLYQENYLGYKWLSIESMQLTSWIVPPNSFKLSPRNCSKPQKQLCQCNWQGTMGMEHWNCSHQFYKNFNVFRWTNEILLWLNFQPWKHPAILNKVGRCRSCRRSAEGHPVCSALTSSLLSQQQERGTISETV